MSAQPFASTWLKTEEHRTPYIELDAFHHYWNKKRGPRLEKVIFRNDLSKEEALRRCISAEGQVDIVTEVAPENAGVVEASPFAKLVAVDANKVLAGTFNRYLTDVDFNDRRLREAINLSIDRQKLMMYGFSGYAKPIPALTPTWAFDFPEMLKSKPHDPEKARSLMNQAGWPEGRVLRLATLEKFQLPAQVVADDLQTSLGIDVQLMIFPKQKEVDWLRVLAEKKLMPNWDICIVDATALFLEATPAFIHRAYLGFDGEFRAGPVLEPFEQLFKKMASQTNNQKRLQTAKQIDKYVYDESLALFLCSPQALYAVNNHVHFRPYRTTFELADTEVDEEHWSRRNSY